MKKTITFMLTLCICGILFAQQQPSSTCHQHTEATKIEEMVSDLSAIQKKRLEVATQRSQKQITKMRDELKTVRKTIRNILKTDGDQSDKLFPLFDREGDLQAEIAKEMYRCRQQIDKILTPEQLREFRTRCEKERKQKAAAETTKLSKQKTTSKR